jgi:IS1 family transposase
MEQLLPASSFSCYYCDDYKPYIKSDYERHVVMKHGHSPAYPNKAEIEKLGLKAQGKDWERQ